jgi:hypothetical protein
LQRSLQDPFLAANADRQPPQNARQIFYGYIIVALKNTLPVRLAKQHWGGEFFNDKTI